MKNRLDKTTTLTLNSSELGLLFTACDEWLGRVQSPDILEKLTEMKELLFKKIQKLEKKEVKNGESERESIGSFNEERDSSFDIHE